MLIFFDPLKLWIPYTRFVLPVGLLQFFEFMLTWMGLGMTVVTFRFTYVAIQETVNYLTHGLMHKDHH